MRNSGFCWMNDLINPEAHEYGRKEKRSFLDGSKAFHASLLLTIPIPPFSASIPLRSRTNAPVFAVPT